MRIFVGYHYGPSDAWVEKLIYPLIEAFSDKVVDGKNEYGDANLSQAIIDKISNCDALIGVASRDQPLGQGQYYSTHPWILGELTTAKAKEKLFIQVRENGVDPRQGILEGAQYLEYNAANLAECLLEIAKALGKWHLMSNIQPILVPTEFAAAVTPLLNSDGFVCEYRIFDSSFEEKSRGPTRIVPTPGGLRVALRGIPREHFIQIRATHGEKKWVSDLVSVDTPIIIMK